MKRYSDLIKLPTFEERFKYLKLTDSVGDISFGGSRFMYQNFLRSSIWKSFRREIIIRDDGCDLGIDAFPIYGKVLVHHLNPITVEDLYNPELKILNPENVICVGSKTHNEIHYGLGDSNFNKIIERQQGDTKLW